MTTLEDIAREVVRLDGEAHADRSYARIEEARYAASAAAPRLARALLAILPAIERLREATNSLSEGVRARSVTDETRNEMGLAVMALLAAYRAKVTS